MGKGIVTIGAFIIGSALVWGAVILGCSYTLKGTDCYGQIQNILAMGSVVHIVLIWGPLAVLFGKMKLTEKNNQL